MLKVEEIETNHCYGCRKGYHIEDYTVCFPDGTVARPQMPGVIVAAGPDWALTKLVLCRDCAEQLAGIIDTLSLRANVGDK